MNKDTELRPFSDEENQPKPIKLTVVQSGAQRVASQIKVAQFRGRAMILETEPFPHFVVLHRDKFDQIAYPLLGGLTRGRMGDIFSYLGSTATDISGHDRYVLFGLADGPHRVWDTRELDWVENVDPELAIWRSEYGPINGDEDRSVELVMQLAGGDAEVYDDILQSLAPLVMEKKPDGVIWWVGDGANGKSTLMDAIYKIFPGQLSSLNVKRLTDGRDIPSLNGTMANVVKESSEGKIDDTEIYKSIATHENFRVHRFHSQDDMEIRGNIHHIFSANLIPAFNDKGFSARRRTFVIPFGQRFESDPTFEQRTFTSEMFGGLITEMCRYAQQLRDQGYRYKWSAITMGAKEDYDTEANSAEEYARQLVADGVTGFDSFLPVRMDYDNWCADNGYVPLGVGNMRRAIQAAGFERLSVRSETGVVKRYKLGHIESLEMVNFSLGRPGFFTVPGFRPEAPVVEAPVPSFHEPAEQPDCSEAPEPPPILAEPKVKTADITGGKW